MKWSILSERNWLGMGPFLILTNIDGGDVEEICHFQIEKLRSHGNISHIIANVVWGDLDDMIVLREGKWLCRVFSTQRFSWRNLRIFRRENWLWLTISCVIFILIMETLWIHCHVRKLFRKNTLCNQYTINKRRPVVQRPSRLKSKNSRTPAGWPSQRGTYLSNFDDSSILLKSVGVAENFERCEDFW